MSGPLQNQSERYTWYYSVFAENKLTFGKLSITPGPESREHLAIGQ